MVAVAIDFGTTYSSIAIWRNNNVEIIPNEEGSRQTPSYVAFLNNERLIGQAAKNQASVNPHNTIFGIKRLIGRRFDDILKNDLRSLPYSVINENGKPMIVVTYKGYCRQFAPEEISAMIILRLKELAESYLGTPVRKAVVTVPSYFTDSQRQATLLAVTIAEFDVIGIIDEPTAAALCYGLAEKQNRKLLVFGLGGGTLDVSIISVEEGPFYKVLATAGNLRLGGEDFDNCLLKYFLEDFYKKFGKSIDDPGHLCHLRNVAEQVKHSLSSHIAVPVVIELFSNSVTYSENIRRSLFENLCSDLFQETLKHVDSVLQSARMEKCDIDTVIMFGGGTRIPKIKRLLSKFLNGKVILNQDNPDETIVSGAAMHAAVLGEVNMTRNVQLVDVLPLSLGIETYGGLMLKVVERNTPLPCSQVTEITTLEEYQTSMTIEIYEGERAFTIDNQLLGIFQLINIPPAPRGQAKINIKFEVDINGILTVTCNKGIGDNESIIIENIHRPRHKEISKFVSEAREFREEDLENKQRLEVRNQLESFIYDVKHSFMSNMNKIEISDFTLMSEECKNALSWLDHNKNCMREELEEKMSELLLRWSIPMQNLKAKLEYHPIPNFNVDMEELCIAMKD